MKQAHPLDVKAKKDERKAKKDERKAKKDERRIIVDETINNLLRNRGVAKKTEVYTSVRIRLKQMKCSYSVTKNTALRRWSHLFPSPTGMRGAGPIEAVCLGSTCPDERLVRHGVIAFGEMQLTTWYCPKPRFDRRKISGESPRCSLESEMNETPSEPESVEDAVEADSEADAGGEGVCGIDGGAAGNAEGDSASSPNFPPASGLGPKEWSPERAQSDIEAHAQSPLPDHAAEEVAPLQQREEFY